MPDDQQQNQNYRLRRIAPEDMQSQPQSASSSSSSGANNARTAAVIAADTQRIEEIIRRAMDSSNLAPSDSSSSPNSADQIASLRSQLSSSQQARDRLLNELNQLKQAFSALEGKHQQFVEANIAFTQWRDQVDKERASWADANAKFAKRHEENKAAKANLMAKYKAALEDLEDLKQRYDGAKREISRITGTTAPPTPPLASTRNNSASSTAIDQDKGTRRDRHHHSLPPPPKQDRSVRGVERDSPRELTHRQPPYPPYANQVEQSVLRERLTSDMFTLSQKVLEERANRAEEARQMAERRIFELEGQIARGKVNGSSSIEHPHDHDRYRNGPPDMGIPPPPPHYQPHHSRRDSNGSSPWTHSPHLPPPPQQHHRGGPSSGPSPSSYYSPNPPSNAVRERERDLERFREQDIRDRDRDRDRDRMMDDDRYRDRDYYDRDRERDRDRDRVSPRMSGSSKDRERERERDYYDSRDRDRDSRSDHSPGGQRRPPSRSDSGSGRRYLDVGDDMEIEANSSLR
ncbi:hypothetical protein FRC03_007106 [Tulasnella sp. 419]|nr:hypothetical protein FRC02_004820 [Tulasnella sp. 418]KAG8960061.1 hypothetical protein FRC03_007106 [Tulasnella sp. 419]